MKKVILLTLVSLSLLSANAQSTKAYAITADVKGSYNWISVKEIDMSTGEVVNSIFDPASSKFNLKTVDGQTLSSRSMFDLPTYSGVAAAAFDEKNNRLYFTNMRGSELRYFDLNTKEQVTVVVNSDPAFNTGSKSGEENVITRMVIAADGYG
ncbi:MAG TPA: hypothetical protein VF145_00530, partial [Chitinophagaceae bacterium]